LGLNGQFHKYALLPKETTHDIINEIKVHFLFMPCWQSRKPLSVCY